MIENYFERITYNSRPHENFSQEWSNYSSSEFAQAFLPYVNKYHSKHLDVFDGAELFVNGVKEEEKQFLSNTKIQIPKLSVFTFADIENLSNKKDSIKIADKEVVMLISVSQESTLTISFKFGRRFRNGLNRYFRKVKSLERTHSLENLTFSATKVDFESAFGKAAGYTEVMNFILKRIGFENRTISLEDKNRRYSEIFNQIENNGFLDLDEIPFDAGVSQGEYPGSWAHGDIEREALKAARYQELEIMQVYYGNWLRDMSSSIDTLAIGFTVPDANLLRKSRFYYEKEVVRNKFDPFWMLTQKCLAELLGYYTTQTFIKGLGDKEPTANFDDYLAEHKKRFDAFSVDVLGIYKPEEHIDNPKYLPDASIFGTKKLIGRKDTRLPGGLRLVNDPYPHYHINGLENPIVSVIDYMDEYGQTTQRLQTLSPGKLPLQVNAAPYAISESLKITEENMKAYIKVDFEERPSSLTFVSQQLRLAASRGRSKVGFRHLGAAFHVLEDYFAHTNFVELALIKHGKLMVEPWVELDEEIKGLEDGVDKSSRIPIVTGTFGSADVAASLLPKVLNAFRPKESVEIRVKTKDRTFFDKAFISIIDDFILREKGLPPQKKMNVLGYSFIEIKSLFNNYLDLRDWYLDITDNAVSNFLRDVGEAFNSITEGLNLFSMLYDYIVDLLINWLLDIISRGGQMLIGEAELYNNEHYGTDPTHTQLAKDSPLHPLNPLAGRLAKVVVEDIGKRMTKCWKRQEGYTVDKIIARIDQTYMVHPVNAPAEFDEQGKEKKNWVDKVVLDWIDENQSFMDKLINYKNEEHGGHFPTRKPTRKKMEKTFMERLEELFGDLQQYVII